VQQTKEKTLEYGSKVSLVLVIHFAKIMGYLLENRRLEDGRYAVDIFLNRIKGLDQETEIKGLLHQASLNLTSHSIMYQIESEHDQLDEKTSISKTIYIQFLKQSGSQ
jgi:hypothetical protein